ncbi:MULTISPECIES: alpha/beta hydrolase [Mycobacterium]|jgi:dienelactone hydrolase|uniref:Alpha/beta hydrolase n=1 Tax=Mycobacterium gordonae TaxID=1778 RepID=A0A1A6B958_MYCGO|nr:MULTISPECIES: alpha/beta hydrolase [Mycobacterium]MBX9979127.1 alpha/beta hydrolase [Mycobacterium gordonae]MCQ4361626.1 alpha/beta hydrolase [Mycobacterium gordonae]MCV7006504.1 alpha/beta hydrolase [Mycobacterium gordonae]OBR98825.1 alpha/beta hydrolase [Mycobacterium gordonae]ODR19021.1 alpha/beta hydrolase [Mycobacterium gordonae]
MPQREDVSFISGLNSREDRISAWLYRPDTDGPAPVLVMGHGLGAVRTMRLDAYAERFRAAGYACLVFDYRNFGDSEGQPRQLLDIDMQLADWAAAVDYARTVPGLDPDRIALWGTSFGGGHVIESAARLPGIAAAVAQCPFTDGLASIAAINPVTAARVTALALRDLLAARRGKPPVMIPTAGMPGEVAVMTAPDAYPGYLRLVPDGVELRNEIAARIGLKVLLYRPGRSAARIPCPILFCVCETDSVAPAGPTLRYAAKAPRGEIKTYPEGHFAIYVDDAFERVVTDQIAFLDRHLQTARN